MFPGIRTAALRVADLFADPYFFTVPAYQRPYSWTRKEASQLLDDLLEALGADPSAPDQPDYFLGAMLMVDHGQTREKSQSSAAGTQAEGSSPLDIVDGQQRLVTLTIMMAVLRDLTEHAPSRQRLNELLAVPAGRQETAHRFRIELRNRDQPFFERTVQRPGACRLVAGGDELTTGERAILEVRDFFIQSVAALGADERAGLCDYLMEQCHVVLMLIGDIDRGHRMFSVLNDRGRPLARKDIVKAEVLGATPDEASDKIVDLWETIEQDLGSEFDDFFSYLRAIYHYQRLPVIGAVRRIVGQAGDGARFVEHTIAPLAEAYLRICKAEHEGSPHSAAIRQQLRWLGLLKSKEWVPAAMLALQLHRNDPARLLADLVAMDRFAHALQILCLGAGKRIRRFADVLDTLKAGQPLDKSPVLALSREENRNMLYNLETLHARNPQVCKIVLLRINDMLAGGLEGLDPKKFTVEHVLPRKPNKTSEWRDWFPDTEEREACTHSLGNLVLVTREQNEKARNQEFARKKDVYFSTRGLNAPAITRDVQRFAEWKPEQIRAREKRMHEALRRLWGINASAADQQR